MSDSLSEQERDLQKSAPRERVLLVGCGDLAQRLTALRAGDWCFTGVRRSAGNLPHIETVQADATDTDALRELLAQGFDAVVATLTPAGFNDDGYRQGYVMPATALRDACAALPEQQRPRRILWVSSTRVYGAAEGDWVDENTATRPEGFAGRRLLEAEQLLLEGPVPTTVVRFTGIYGPGRNRLINKVRAGRIAPAEPVQWTNRIHSEDCAGVLAHLIERDRREEPVADCYIGTDCAPVTAHEVQSWLAARMGVAAEEEPAGEVRANRRCSNRRLLASGYRFIYPDWRAGFGELLG